MLARTARPLSIPYPNANSDINIPAADSVISARRPIRWVKKRQVSIVEQKKSADFDKIYWWECHNCVDYSNTERDIGRSAREHACKYGVAVVEHSVDA